MKNKNLIFLCSGMIFLAGCSWSSSVQISNDPIETTTPSSASSQKIQDVKPRSSSPNTSPTSSVKTDTSLKIKTVNPMQEIINQIDAQIASEKSFTFSLPNATSVITKREMTGTLNAESTGKIVRVTEGAANLTETFYFEKGELVYAKTESSGSKNEMFLKGTKVEAYLANGKDDLQNKNLEYLKERNQEDAKFILEQFILQKQMNNQ